MIDGVGWHCHSVKVGCEITVNAEMWFGGTPGGCQVYHYHAKWHSCDKDKSATHDHHELAKHAAANTAYLDVERFYDSKRRQQTSNGNPECLRNQEHLTQDDSMKCKQRLESNRMLKISAGVQNGIRTCRVPVSPSTNCISETSVKTKFPQFT